MPPTRYYTIPEEELEEMLTVKPLLPEVPTHGARLFSVVQEALKKHKESTGTVT